MNDDTTHPSALLRRWQRLHLQVRCALHVDRPSLIWQCLACGTLLTRRCRLDATRTQRRMLLVLLQTAADAALPWFWRSVCLEHCTQPLARLSALLRPHDLAAFEAIDAAVQHAAQALPACPSAAESLQPRR